MELDAIAEIKGHEKKKVRFDKVMIECYNCYKKGYYIKEYKSPKQERQIKATSYNEEIEYDEDWTPYEVMDHSGNEDLYRIKEY